MICTSCGLKVESSSREWENSESPRQFAGLKPTQRQRLNRLYNRKVPRDAIVSAPLATTLCELSHDLRRQIEVTLDQRGRVRHVIVGDAEQLFIPDLGRS